MLDPDQLLEAGLPRILRGLLRCQRGAGGTRGDRFGEVGAIDVEGLARALDSFSVALGQIDVLHRAVKGLGFVGQVRVGGRALRLDVGPVFLEDRPQADDGGVAQEVHAPRGGALRIARVPERRVRLLFGAQRHVEVLELEESPPVREELVRQAAEEHLERLFEAGVGLLRVAAPHLPLGAAGGTPTDADLVAAAAELVDHADLFDEADGVMQRQDRDQGPEAEVCRALGDRGKKDGLVRRDAERRVVMLGHVVAVDSGLVGLLREAKPLGELLRQIDVRTLLDVVENTELEHAGLLSSRGIRVRLTGVRCDDKHRRATLTAPDPTIAPSPSGSVRRRAIEPPFCSIGA